MCKQEKTQELEPALLAVDFTEEQLSILLTSIEFETIYQDNWQLPKLESENAWSWEIGGRIATSFIQNKKPYYALAIAIGCPGTIDSGNGVILDSRNNDTFNGFHITDAIRRHIDTPVAAIDRIQATFHGAINMNKNQYKNDSLFVYFEDEFCISTIKISELYFPADFFRYRKKSEEQLSKKIFEIANSLQLEQIYIHSEQNLTLVNKIITNMNESNRKIDVTKPVIKEDTTLKGLIDIAASIAYENQIVVFQ